MGGYGRSINDGQSIVFVVYWHNNLKYCVEVSPNNGRLGQLSQFSGQRNSDPVWAEEEAVCSALKQAGLLNY